MKWSDFSKKLRVSVPPKGNVLLSGTTSVTDNGTWTVGGGASNLAADTLYTVAYPSSLSFSLSGSGYLENSTLTPLDVTVYGDQSVGFVWAYFQGSNLPSSVELQWGSSSSDHYSRTVTSNFDGTAFRDGWNLLGFAWQGAAVTGTPAVDVINYARFTVNGVGSASPVRISGITFSLGQIYEITYYSKYIFRDLSGAFKEKPTLDSDMLNLDTDATAVFADCLAMLAAQQAQGKDSAFDLGFFRQQYQDSKDNYARKNPSRAMKAGTPYYVVKREVFTAV